MGTDNINADIAMLYSDPDQLLMLAREHMRQYYAGLN
jgi:hypothetical protein